MTSVNMKKIEAMIESQIMLMINRNPGRGLSVETVKAYFSPGHRPIIGDPVTVTIPDIVALSAHKRRNRVYKVIERLVSSGRCRKEVQETRYSIYATTQEHLIPLNALDKIVYALELADQVEYPLGEEAQ